MAELTEWDLKQKCKELEKYNGWTNYETWAVGLWIDNDEGLQNRTTELANDLFKEAHKDPNVKDKIWSVCETAKFRLADALKEQFEDENPLSDKANVYSDLMNSALGDVDWHEVAEHYLPDVCVRELEKKKRR
jgi:hypothetical protein